MNTKKKLLDPAKIDLAFKATCEAGDLIAKARGEP
jgi:hypothetical protein